MRAFTWLIDRSHRAWDETVAPPMFGEAPALRRLLRIRMRSALVISVPAHLVLLFYVVQGCVAHYRTVRGTRDREPLSLELFRLHVHDRLRRDYHRLFAGSSSPSPELEKLSLGVRNDLLDRLDAHLPPTDGAEGYVAGTLEHRGNRYDVEVRYRGSRHWNWNYAQKSWKVRLKRDRRLLGHDALLLNNSPEPEPLLELVALDLARHRGLMVPDYEPVWVELNGAPFGVYFLEAPVDESVLRNSRRFPWNVYSGNGAPADPKTGVSRLFESASFWSKVAGPVGQEKDLHELEDLLARVAHASPAAFQRFAEDHLDLRAFAELDALDVAFGIDQHNYDENQKIYYDPYRGVFEPVVWNLRGGTHEPVVQRAASPLVLRLSELASFADLRDRAVLELLDTALAPEALAAALSRWDSRLSGAFEQDPYWDASNLLPDLSPYYGDMVRPMDRARQLEARAIVLARLHERRDFLRRELGRASLDAELFMTGKTGVVRLNVDGRAPFELLAFAPRFAAPCAEPIAWRRRGLDRNALGAAAVAPDSRGVLDVLFPGTERVRRPITPERGAVRVEPRARAYDFELDTACGAPVGVTVRARNRRTGEIAVVESSVHDAPAPDPDPCPSAFEPGPGGRSTHPWCALEAPAPADVQLGPGEVPIEGTRVFAAETHVVIAPGTTIRMGRRANVVFRGRVTAEGSASAPIRVSGIDWGAFVIQGHGADGSSLAHVDLSGGSGSVIDDRHYTGMVDVYDTARFTLHDALLHGATGGDILHLVYVHEAALTRVVVERSPSDGLDLEHSDAVLRSVSVLGAADDALDLMGSRIVAEDLNLLDCADNGVSAGEQSDVQLERSVVLRCPTGLLAKNESRIAISDVAVVGARVGIRVVRRSDYYTGESSARGARLWFVAVDEPKQLVARPSFDVAPCGEPDARDIAPVLETRGLAQASDLLGWRGPGRVSP